MTPFRSLVSFWSGSWAPGAVTLSSSQDPGRGFRSRVLRSLLLLVFALAASSAACVPDHWLMKTAGVNSTRPAWGVNPSTFPSTFCNGPARLENAGPSVPSPQNRAGTPWEPRAWTWLPQGLGETEDQLRAALLLQDILMMGVWWGHGGQLRKLTEETCKLKYALALRICGIRAPHISCAGDTMDVVSASRPDCQSSFNCIRLFSFRNLKPFNMFFISISVTPASPPGKSLFCPQT